MKKLFLLSICLFLSVVMYGQVKFQDMTIAKAVEVAKKENKLVMVLASATW